MSANSTVCASKNIKTCNSSHGHLLQVKVVSEPERIDVFLTRSCVQLTDISCGVVYEATLASLVLFRSYRYVHSLQSKRFFARFDNNVQKQTERLKFARQIQM